MFCGVIRCSALGAPAVKVHPFGMNGANVCAFARHGRVHVAKWLTEHRADVLLVRQLYSSLYSAVIDSKCLLAFLLPCSYYFTK